MAAVVALRPGVVVDEVAAAAVVVEDEGDSTVLVLASHKTEERSQHFEEAGVVHARQEGIDRERDDREVHEGGMDQWKEDIRGAAVGDP